MYDIIIIGGGAAGLSAAIYAGRSGLKTLVAEGTSYGGQMNYTYEVDNYPGINDNPAGAELSEKMREHAKKFDIEFTTETVKNISGANDRIKTVETRKNSYLTKTIIFASGASPKRLGAEGEDRFYGVGVSYCATCDGAFFKGQDVAVAGGGNTAFEDALYLARFAKSVTLIHRRDQFRAVSTLVEKAKENPKIKFVLNSEIDKIEGDTTVSGIEVVNNKTNKRTDIPVSGVFIAVGITPKSELAGRYVDLDENGFIITNEKMETSVPGIYAAGDVRNTPLRQIVTAAADGAVAATYAVNFING